MEICLPLQSYKLIGMKNVIGEEKNVNTVLNVYFNGHVLLKSNGSFFCFLLFSKDNVSYLCLHTTPTHSQKEYMSFTVLPGSKENHFYSLPFGQAEASIY